MTEIQSLFIVDDDPRVTSKLIESLLIVDDDLLVLERLSRELRPWVGDVRKAGSMEEALAALDPDRPDVDVGRPDLVLVDLYLPSPGKGMVVARAALELVPTPYVVVMTSQAERPSGTPGCINVNFAAMVCAAREVARDYNYCVSSALRARRLIDLSAPPTT